MSTEERISILERDITEMKHALAILQGQRLRQPVELDWIERIKGCMKDQPGSEEMVRFGREARQSQALCEDNAP